MHGEQLEQQAHKEDEYQRLTRSYLPGCHSRLAPRFQHHRKLNVHLKYGQEHCTYKNEDWMFSGPLTFAVVAYLKTLTNHRHWQPIFVRDGLKCGGDIAPDCSSSLVNCDITPASYFEP